MGWRGHGDGVLVRLLIDNREYILSPRLAVDVLTLAEFAKRKDKSLTVLEEAQILAQVVSDSLRATYVKLGRIRGWRYRKFASTSGRSFLINRLSMQEIGEAFIYVKEELEGDKKKAPTPTPSPSGGKSRKG
jgi:hypothetical protein